MGRHKYTKREPGSAQCFAPGFDQDIIPGFTQCFTPGFAQNGEQFNQGEVQVFFDISKNLTKVLRN